MAITTEFSAEFTAAHITAGGKLNNVNYGGSLQSFRFTYVQSAAAGDIGSIQKLIKIPPGKWTLYAPLCFLQWDAFGAARTLGIGWEAYVDKDGTTVAASALGITAAIDVSSAGQGNGAGAVNTGIGTAIAAGVGRCLDFTSRDGVIIEAIVAGGTIPAAAKLSGYFLLAGGGN